LNPPQSSPDARDVLRRGTVKAVAGAIQAGDQITEAGDQITAAVARRATPADSASERSDPDG
jgi:hypothetical protein